MGTAAYTDTYYDTRPELTDCPSPFISMKFQEYFRHSWQGIEMNMDEISQMGWYVDYMKLMTFCLPFFL